MRLIFLGTPEFALPTLQRLLDSSHQVVGVVTAPDKPAGRSLKLTPSPVKVFAERQGQILFQPVELDDREFLNQIRALKPDIGVVVAFRIMPEALFKLPLRGCVNLHPSLLPDLRGAAPINWALIRGYTRSGVSIFELEKKVDAGKILTQTSVDIHPADNAGSLSERLAQIGAELMVQTLDGITAGSLEPVVQTGPVTSAPRLERETGRINWNRPAEEIHNLVRGLAPEPGAWTLLNGEMLKVFETQVVAAFCPDTPGTIIGYQDGLIIVNTGEYCLGLRSLQIAGKKRMTASDFIRGRPLPNGKWVLTG